METFKPGCKKICFPINSLQFDTDPDVPDPVAGEVWWNSRVLTLNIETGVGPTLQPCFEDIFWVHNDTGEDMADGVPVHPIGGATDGRPHVELARADYHTGFSRAVWVITMAIPAGTAGMATKRGEVHGVDTSAFEVGDNLWVSPTVAGGYVTEAPDFPNYVIQIGGVAVAAEDGTLLVSVLGQKEDTFNNFWNGTFRESFDFLISSDGETVTGSLSPSNGHEDLTMMFSDGFSILDTTPDATIPLIPGTDTNPQTNYVYILESLKVMSVSTAGWPSEAHIKIGRSFLQTAATTELNGALRNQNWNDHITGTGQGQGHLSHLGEAIREKIPATWVSGVEGAIDIDTGPTPDDVYFRCTAGVVMQLHTQAFPSFNMGTGDDMHVINHFTTPYLTTTNLQNQVLDANGVSLANGSFSFVIWGVQNKTGEISHVMMNLPIGKYAKNDPDAAVADANNYSVYDIPTDFGGVGFLICRATFSLAAGGLGWALYALEDLRGKIPNATAGGGGTGGGGGGATTYLGLTDTASSYAGQAGKHVIVSSGETGLEFTANDHNLTTSIQGGTTDEYYHLTAARHALLVGGADTDLHFHAADRARAVHTGTQTAATISDFDTEVSNNTSVAANTSHRGLSDNPHSVVYGQTGAEGALGNPTVDGYVLSSTIAGVRTWILMEGGGGGFEDPMTTRGDMIIRNAANETVRLGVGAATQVLTSDGTDLSWQDAPAGVTTFLGLTDTPAAYVAYKLMGANAAGDALETKEIYYNASNSVFGGGSSLTSGTGNTLHGVGAGDGLTNNIGNVMIGNNAGNAITQNYNTIIGFEACKTATATSNSVFIGMRSGYSMVGVAGNYPNTAIGYESLYSCATHGGNIAVGYKSLYNCVSNYSIAIGNEAGYSLTNPVGTMVAIGRQAGYYNETGGYNTFIGSYAGKGVSGKSPTYNTFIGYQSGLAVETATKNVGVGSDSLKALSTGTNNVGLGPGALQSITTQSAHIGIGTNAGAALTTGQSLTAIGLYAGDAVTEGHYNIAIGTYSVSGNQTGNYNVGVGYATINGNANPANCSAVGHNALGKCTTNNNTAIGYSAGYNTTGGGNNYFGASAGYSRTTGTYGLVIGPYTAAAEATTNYFMDIRGHPSHPFLQGYMLNNTSGYFKVYPRLRLKPQATPVTPTAGDGYFDSTSNTWRVYNGTDWLESGSDVFTNRTTAGAPATPVAGHHFFDTTTNTLKVYDGSSWQEVAFV